MNWKWLWRFLEAQVVVIALWAALVVTAWVALQVALYGLRAP